MNVVNPTGNIIGSSELASLSDNYCLYYFFLIRVVIYINKKYIYETQHLFLQPSAVGE
jgi:hypothetical protein